MALKNVSPDPHLPTASLVCRSVENEECESVAPPTDTIAQFTKQLKHSLQGNNDIKRPCHIRIPVHVPAYTILPPAHWREIGLDYRHATAKASVSIACSSFISRLEDQFSFSAKRSTMKIPFPILQKGVFRHSRGCGSRIFPGGKAPRPSPHLLLILLPW